MRSAGKLCTFCAIYACENLLAGVPGVFSRGSPIFAPFTDWPVSYELE